ncbi:uncharacterized protein LOC120071641 [Benincasa hispida]|uniref:uncharacterized protein LOC120071641 n=1 Tax=Benincasa hispida TaxID=102211 RepID=UPI0019011099|nr:uncharacterized protein LOC120071641 [Benincasa hispida]XP_038879933.1 uncharacterized protein LOC120071641 [Benincasa hispida]
MSNEFSDLVVHNMRKSRSMEKNKLKVEDIESFKRSCYNVVEESDDESEANGDRMSWYSSKSSIEDELPELVVFLQETNYEFVKDICIDESATSRGKWFEENCDTENGYVHRMLNRDTLESDDESTEESEDLESSISSTESTQTLDEKQKAHSDALDEIPSEVPPHKKSVPKLFLDRKVTGRKGAAGSTNSIAISLTKILDENKHKGKGVTRSNIEHGSIRNSGLSQSSNWTAGCGRCCDCGSTSMTEDYTQENERGLYSSHCGFVYQREDGSSAVDPTRPSLTSYLGSASLRSNGSTNSSHSFAFPILPTEWNGSPERMVKADPLQTRRRQLWRLCFPCCNF